MTTQRPPAFFTADGDGFNPSIMAQGPWGSTIAGNFVGGILGHVVENAVTDRGLTPARLTVDLLRPAALAPLRGRSSIVRQGRRLVLVEAELLQSDTVVARATALFLRRGEQPSGEVWTTPLAMPPIPLAPTGPSVGVPLLIWAYGRNGHAAGRSFDLTEWQHDGPKFVWVRDLVPLIAGVPTTPFVRASMAGDVASSLTHYGTAGLNYINADYTLTMSRLPEGEDIGLAALTYTGDDGVGTGTAALFDHRGQIGTATATTLANTGFSPPTSR
ncbi:acyl-CoA thioesterase domain-containing protein [Mycolicibacterium hodleri]|uniref:Thioesterase family protein n=1 Tax=Mycolicibacterium hodleri TaxID=49897 RepID=A0A502EBU9_9MYCO|nr:acyl-CoA thioesterase domain-containing protein [Mycolicibacterium hodleri]TPG35138.1 thioesterase family protein [Mycolicibacterium hodleri]